MSQTRLIAEAKGHLVHKIAPHLIPNIRGLFRVQLVGLYRNRGQLAIAIVNERDEVLKQFGSNIVRVGGSVIIDKFSSIVNFAPGTPAVEGYFNAWIIGINAENTEAEISLRLVDKDHKQIKNFGSKTIKAGKSITLKGMDIQINIIPEHMT